MVDRGESSGTEGDPDDWFSNADLESTRRASGEVAATREPTWLEDVAAPEERTADDPFARRRVVALAVAALVLVVAAAVAVIAFGGGGSGTPQPATTTAQATTPVNTLPVTTPPPPPAPVVLPAGVLKPGAAGDEVKALQRALARAGHSPGSIDGDYGPTTEQAVAALQRSAGLTADGIYGPQTRKALQQAVTSG